MSPNHSASRWYAYNLRADLRKPETPVSAFKSIALPVPGNVPQRLMCNVALRPTPLNNRT